MLNNYPYFIALAETRNISKAAQKLFISHQCLSRYLKNLEQTYHVTFFERTPKLTLTPAGHAYLDTIRQVQLLEENLDSQLEDIRQAKRGYLRVATTEGRYRILIPDLLARFKRIYPDVVLDVQYGSNSKLLSERVLENELDITLLNKSDISHNQLEMRPILKEQLYLVISDQMLESYFPNRYPKCKQEFSSGVDLAQFQHVPFVMGQRHQNSRETLERYLQERNLHLNCIMELSQLDLHFMITARDVAASFCWSMYIPTIQKMNQEPELSHLNVFPVKGRGLINHLMLITRKGKLFPAYGRDFIQLIREECSRFADPQLDSI